MQPTAQAVGFANSSPGGATETITPASWERHVCPQVQRDNPCRNQGDGRGSGRKHQSGTRARRRPPRTQQSLTYGIHATTAAASQAECAARPRETRGLCRTNSQRTPKPSGFLVPHPAHNRVSYSAIRHAQNTRQDNIHVAINDQGEKGKRWSQSAPPRSC
jgi:hypothetical protein